MTAPGGPPGAGRRYHIRWHVLSPTPAGGVSSRTGHGPILRFMALMTSTHDRNTVMGWSVIGMYLERGSAPQDRFALSLSPTDSKSSGRRGVVYLNLRSVVSMICHGSVARAVAAEVCPIVGAQSARLGGWVPEL